MTAQQLASVLAWCTGIGYATLLLWAASWLGARDALYRMHRRWFAVERPTYDGVMLTLIAAFKLALIIFFALPLIALYASGVVGGGT